MAAPPPKGGILAGDLRRQRTEEQPGTDPGGPHRRLSRQSGQDHRFNGRKGDLSGHQAGPRGGRQPFHHHQDTNNLLKAWRKPQTVIVHEPYWTATAKHADIVLPVTTSYERNDLEMGATSPSAMCSRCTSACRPSLKPATTSTSSAPSPPSWACRSSTPKEGRDAVAGKTDVRRHGGPGPGARSLPGNMFWGQQHFASRRKRTASGSSRRFSRTRCSTARPVRQIGSSPTRLRAWVAADCASHPKWYEPKGVKSERRHCAVAQHLPPDPAAALQLDNTRCGTSSPSPTGSHLIHPLTPRPGHPGWRSGARLQRARQIWWGA